MAIASKLSLSWAPTLPCQTTPGATTPPPSSPDLCHFGHSRVVDTSTCFDHCLLRRRGRHPAPQRGSTRLPLFLQRAPSCSTQDPPSRQRIGQFCVDHTSSPGQPRSFCTRYRCVPASHQPKCSFSLAGSSSSSSPSGASSVRSVLPDATHLACLEALSRFLTDRRSPFP